MISNKKIPCSIIRSGTSKGVFFLKNDLPSDDKERDELLLKIMGSPDVNQINGLGGARSVASKIAIISVSERVDADIDYTFAQVSIDKPIISYKGNCGNISSGVGPFAIEKRLVSVKEPLTKVRIFNTNTQKVIVEEVYVKDGEVVYDGDYAIAGVPGTAAPIRLRFINPSGSVTGQLLPTGNVVDKLEVEGAGTFNVSIVDVTNPLVFVKADDIGMDGKETPEAIDSNQELLDLLEKIRGNAAVKIGLIDEYRESAKKTPTVPKLAIVAKADSYITVSGKQVGDNEIDILCRMMSMQKSHPTYAMTGAMCTAAAAMVNGTIVNQLMRGNFDPECIKIGHAGGIIEAGIIYEIKNGQMEICDAFGYRTARLLLEGYAAK